MRRAIQRAVKTALIGQHVILAKALPGVISAWFHDDKCPHREVMINGLTAAFQGGNHFRGAATGQCPTVLLRLADIRQRKAR